MPRKSYGPQWKMICILMLVWPLLLGGFSLGTLVAGAVIGAAITVIFPLPPVQYVGRLRPIGQLVLSWRLLVDLVVSSFAVALLAFRRRPVRNAMIRVKLRTDSDLYQTLTSELVSLVPGTIVVEASHSRRTLYLHVLGVDTLEELERVRREVLAAEARVVRAYGSRAERALVEGDAP